MFTPQVCNGAYKFDGLHQGKPLFKSDKGAIIYFQRFFGPEQVASCHFSRPCGGWHSKPKPF